MLRVFAEHAFDQWRERWTLPLPDFLLPLGIDKVLAHPELTSRRPLELFALWKTIPVADRVNFGLKHLNCF